jgi:hypothetical protein
MWKESVLDKVNQTPKHTFSHHIISWRRKFGLNPKIIGLSLKITGLSFKIIGWNKKEQETEENDSHNA